jgi:hypothetical protein
MGAQVGKHSQREAPGRSYPSKIVALTLLVGLAGGCALDPYVKIDPPTTSAEADGTPADITYSTHLNDLKQARERSVGVLATIESYRGQYAIADAVLDIITFGAAAAGGVAAVYGASTNLVLGLGLTATGAFTANSVFVGQDRIALYMSAARSLHCVINTADQAAATEQSVTESMAGETYRELEKKVWDALSVVERISPPTQEDKTLIEAAYKSLASYHAAKENLRTFQGQDAAFAQVIHETTGVIVAAMNQRLAALNPTPDQIFKLASGIGGVGANFVSQVTPQPPSKPEGGGAEAAAAAEPTEQEARSNLRVYTPQLQQAADSITQRLSAAGNKVAAVATTCVLDEKPPVPLKLAGSNAVTLAKEGQVKLTFTDGRPPLTASWKGDKVPQIEVVTVGHEMVLYAKSNVTAADYVLVVQDSLAIPSNIQIKVTVK